jgi:parallel beta-helix repeat protein
MFKHRLFGVAALALALAVPPLGAAALPSSAARASVTSGHLLITTDTRLADDHQGPVEIGADGVTLDCAGHHIASSGFAGILIQGRRGVVVKNCDVSGFFHGIVVVGSSDNALRRNTAHDNVAAGIVLDQQSSANLIAANVVRGNGHNGIQISFSHRNVITGNQAEGNAGTGGIALGGAEDNLVAANTSTGNAAFGISVEGARNRVIGNTARSNGAAGVGAGIVVFPNSSDTLVLGNHATDNGEGIRVQGATDSMLVGNRADHNRLWGFIVAAAPNTVLAANLATGNQSHGFALNSTSGVVLRRNVARANGLNGFDVLESSDNTLQGNVSSQNAVGGFSLSRAAGNRLTANTATGNGTPANGPGFELNNSSGNELRGNKAFDNGSTGFFAFGTSERNLISGNAACRNHFFDGGDRSTGAGNTWTGNSFCVTEGI